MSNTLFIRIQYCYQFKLWNQEGLLVLMVMQVVRLLLDVVWCDSKMFELLSCCPSIASGLLLEANQKKLCAWVGFKRGPVKVAATQTDHSTMQRHVKYFYFNETLFYLHTCELWTQRTCQKTESTQLKRGLPQKISQNKHALLQDIFFNISGF